ncbi:MAG: DMT family transporter, partial [Hyphomicrobiales bacterium]|nr:DMT family transporter [Hyphomicrobiales bacterium]
MGALRRFAPWIWHKPAILLVLATMMWAGNAVASRALAGQMSPGTVVIVRWLVVCAVLWPFLGKRFVATLPQLRQNWRYFALMGGLGYTAFNILFYSAAYYTTAVNLTLLQCAIPIFVMLGAFLFTGHSVRAAQIAGMVISTIGVLLVAGAGDLQNVAKLAFNIGDVMALVACALYAGYTLNLRRLPSLDPMVFFAAMALAAALAGLPYFIGEVVSGHSFWPTQRGYIVVIYVAL